MWGRGSQKPSLAVSAIFGLNIFKYFLGLGVWQIYFFMFVELGSPGGCEYFCWAQSEGYVVVMDLLDGCVHVSLVHLYTYRVRLGAAGSGWVRLCPALGEQ